jgi:hypothetical protein
MDWKLCPDKSVIDSELSYLNNRATAAYALQVHACQYLYLCLRVSLHRKVRLYWWADWLTCALHACKCTCMYMHTDEMGVCIDREEVIVRLYWRTSQYIPMNFTCTYIHACEIRPGAHVHVAMVSIWFLIHSSLFLLSANCAHVQ